MSPLLMGLALTWLGSIVLSHSLNFLLHAVMKSVALETQTRTRHGSAWKWGSEKASRGEVTHRGLV
jgi:uncharacterized membrane protein